MARLKDSGLAAPGRRQGATSPNRFCGLYPPLKSERTFLDPEITAKFWFTGGSGRLEVGKTVQWDWEMCDVSVNVVAKIIEPNKRIRIEWPGYGGPTTVEWTFVPHDGATFVTVSESGWTGDADKLMKYVADSTQGFTLMLAGLKAFLEYGMRLNLTADRYPKDVESH